MCYFIPIAYVIIDTGSKYRLTFSVKNGKKAALVAAFFVCQNRFNNILFSSVKLYFLYSLVITNNNFRHLTAIVLEKYTYNIVTIIT